MPPTPFMGLSLPTVGVTLGPEWATEVNQAFSQVDSHNHTTGQGVPIPTNGISVNADFPFQSFNAILLRSTRFVSQGSPIGLVTDLGCLYVVNGDLWFNNLLGQQVQITLGAGLDASTVGGFGGDYGTSTASAFYTSATSTFTFWQNTNQSALMDTGPITLHNTSDIVHGITVQAPASFSSSYNFTLPQNLPASTKILTIDNAGNVGDVYDVDNSTIVVTSNTIGVAPGGITTTQIAPGSVQPNQLGSSNFSASIGTTVTTTSSTYVAVVSTPITTNGRPVAISIIPSGGPGSFTITNSSTAGAMRLAILNNASIIKEFDYQFSGASGVTNKIPCSIVNMIDLSVAGAPGTYVYQLNIESSLLSATVSATNVAIVVYEI